MRQKPLRTAFAVLLAGLGLLSTGPAIAAYGIDAPPAQTSAAGIQYVIGGIGDDERRAMRSAYGHFKLLVEVAEKGGAYSANMQLRIFDAQGRELLNVLVDGPWLLADLPKGDYLLAVRKNDRNFTQKISLGNEAQQQVVFLWPKP